MLRVLKRLKELPRPVRLAVVAKWVPVRTTAVKAPTTATPDRKCLSHDFIPLYPAPAGYFFLDAIKRNVSVSFETMAGGLHSGYCYSTPTESNLPGLGFESGQSQVHRPKKRRKNKTGQWFGIRSVWLLCQVPKKVGRHQSLTFFPTKTRKKPERQKSKKEKTLIEGFSGIYQKR